MLAKGISILLLTFTAYLGMNHAAPARERTAKEKKAAAHKTVEIDGSYTARSVLVYDISSKKTVGAYNASSPRPIASVSKIMAGYIALKYLPANSVITFSENAIRTAEDTGKFKTGESFALRDAISAMMMFSSNDAAMAVAEEVGRRYGGRNYAERIGVFVRLMNKTARELGMESTVFKNPTGLDIEGSPSNFSTAEDLRILIQKSQEDTPLLWELSRDESKIIYSLSGTPHNVFNINKLARHIPYFIGGKTGTTKTAGESLVLLYESPMGKRQALILLDAKFGRRYAEAKNILTQLLPVLL